MRRRPADSAWGAPLLAAAVGVVVTVLLLLPGGATAEAEPELLTRGGELYQSACAACHGTRAEGGPGPDVLAGPAIDATDVAFVDLTLRTGRMPIAEPSVGVRVQQLDDREREAVVAYMVDRFDLPGRIPEVGPGVASRGQEPYVRNCAACHGAAAGGGISGAGVTVPPLIGLDPVAIVAATRVGPFEMPGFDEAVLSDETLDDLVAYLELAAATPRTIAGVREVDQVTSTLYAVLLGLLAAVVVFGVARSRRWYRQEPGGLHADPPFEPRP